MAPPPASDLPPPPVSPTTPITNNNNNNNNNNLHNSSLGSNGGKGPGTPMMQQPQPPPPSIQQQQLQQQPPQNNNQVTSQMGTQPSVYTIPGILHFLQYEWQRFELDRQQWSVEKAELEARIALLQGERKGQENLKNDLVRRIKMLEFCLKQERAKFHKLKHGVDPASGLKVDEPMNDDPLNEDPLLNNNNGDADTTSSVAWKHGRQLLRQYLQEIGYTDTIIDVRSNRVRSLLGLNHSLAMDTSSTNHQTQDGNVSTTGALTTQNMASRTATQIRRPNQVAGSNLISDTEASVLATFEFLNEQERQSGRSGHSSGDEDDDGDEDEEDLVEEIDGGNGSFAIDTETEEVLAEFDFLNNTSRPTGNNVDGNPIGGGGEGRNWIHPDIGELADLTLVNEADMNGGGTANGNTMQNSLNQEFRKTWNPKYILKSHFDSIRSLRFHEKEPLLVTCSEDETLKLWNLNKTSSQTSKGKGNQQAPGTTLDLEPVHTFRGHLHRVLSMALSNNILYSGSEGGELLMWKLPSNFNTIEQYDSFDSAWFPTSLVGHSGPIWSLVNFDTKSGTNVLCSASADATLKVWDTNRRDLLRTISFSDPKLSPTCITHIPANNNNTAGSVSTGSLVAVSFMDGTIGVYDIESPNGDKPVTMFENGGSGVNAIVVHPTMPVLVSAHVDRQIKFWDLNTGKCMHAMVAHLDEVTSLACDPNGLFLLSGSHDCSVRLWNFDNRTCVQEITSHRKKFEEAIFDVAFHPSKPFFASAGSDGLAKVFV